MQAILCIGKFAALGLAFAMLVCFSMAAAGETEVSVGTGEIMTPAELRQIARLAVTQGKSANTGGLIAVNYLEYREGGLRQYVTVEGVPQANSEFALGRIVLIQEFWTKPQPDEDAVDQWIISIGPNEVSTTHRELLESDSRSIEIKTLPAQTGEAVAIGRRIVRTFLQP
jgi:hypothetical protein